MQWRAALHFSADGMIPASALMQARQQRDAMLAAAAVTGDRPMRRKLFTFTTRPIDSLADNMTSQAGGGAR